MKKGRLKKLAIVGTASLAIMLGLSACGSSSSKKSSSNGAKTEQTASTKMSCKKALSQLRTEYSGMAKVKYVSSTKSLIFLVTNANDAQKLQTSANKQAKWFSKVTHKPGIQAQIKFTKSVQAKMNQNGQKKSKNGKNKKNAKQKKNNKNSKVNGNTMKNNKNQKQNNKQNKKRPAVGLAGKPQKKNNKK